ncbi:MAG: hypothetical protein HY459_04000 [Parcubacteria group bacterium]|nr:hypothetical protein [Parcubacteria group bacterium]
MALLIATLILGTISPIHAATQTCNFAGTVFEKGAPVAGATVTVEGAGSVITDSEGKFGPLLFQYDDQAPLDRPITVNLPDGRIAGGGTVKSEWCKAGARVDINIITGQGGTPIVTGILNINPISFDTIEELLQNVIQKIILYSGIAAFIAFMVSGIRYLLAAGNKQELEAAKNMITYTITGMVILAIAYAAVRLVIELLQR